MSAAATGRVVCGVGCMALRVVSLVARLRDVVGKGWVKVGEEEGTGADGPTFFVTGRGTVTCWLHV
jgi:hypothetical protein